MNLIILIPNILTLGNLACGVCAIYFALTGNYLLSAHLIFVGMALDFFDGKAARMTNTVSIFGTYLDSFADIVTFGISPAILTFSLCPSNFKKQISLFLFLYAMSGIFRLIRYTFFDIKIKKNEMFSGLPIPAAAGSLAGFMLVYLRIGISFPYMLVLCVIVLNAVLMVSVLPYQHFSGILKMFPPVAKVFLLIIFCAAMLSKYYFAVIFMFFMLYTIFGIKWQYIYEVKMNSSNNR